VRRSIGLRIPLGSPLEAERNVPEPCRKAGQSATCGMETTCASPAPGGTERGRRSGQARGGQPGLDPGSGKRSILACGEGEEGRTRLACGAGEEGRQPVQSLESFDPLRARRDASPSQPLGMEPRSFFSQEHAHVHVQRWGIRRKRMLLPWFASRALRPSRGPPVARVCGLL
jgi:hypothetical protein